MNSFIEQRLQIDPRFIAWLAYTKQINVIKMGLSCSIKFQGQNQIQLIGPSYDVREAMRRAQKLLTQTYAVRYLHVPNYQASGSMNVYKPYFQLTQEKMYRQMQLRDRGMCVLTRSKFITVAQKLERQYGYTGLLQYSAKLPQVCVMLFCKVSLIHSYIPQIESRIKLIHEKLISYYAELANPQPFQQQITQFKEKEMSCNLMRNGSFSKSIAVQKLDIIWFSQFDKIERLQNEQEVELTIEEDLEKEDQSGVILTIIAEERQTVNKVYSLIINNFLKFYQLKALDSIENQDFNLDQFKGKFRFISQETMGQTAMLLDSKYSTQILKHLKAVEMDDKFTYLLADIKVIPDIVALINGVSPIMKTSSSETSTQVPNLIQQDSASFNDLKEYVLDEDDSGSIIQSDDEELLQVEDEELATDDIMSLLQE